MEQHNVTEITKTIEGLYEKLLICLGNDEMLRKFNASFKNKGFGKEDGLLNKLKTDTFKSKMLMIKSIKNKSFNLFSKYNCHEKMQGIYFTFLKSILYVFDNKF